MKKRSRRFRPKPLTSRRKLLLVGLAALPILLIFTFGNRGLLKRVSLELQYDRAYQELYDARNEGDSLRSEIERMKHDTLSVEKIARERYGMARPDEKIYRVVEE